MGENELSYCELRAKEVVNACDGKRMGRIVDILFSRDDGTVSGIVVPLTRRGMFGKNQDVFIPWRGVQKIGEAVILVHLTEEADGRVTCKREPPHKDGHPHDRHKDCRPNEPPHGGDNDCAPPDRPNCDCRCEKCMLFDCAYRWSQLH